MIVHHFSLKKELVIAKENVLPEELRN